MSKYDPLYIHLSDVEASRICMRFEEIERIVGFELPRSAKHRNAWWGNEEVDARHPQCGSWRSAGFKVRDVNLTQQSVAFERA